MDTLELLTRFEARQIEAAEFSHRRHLEVAYAMLGKYDFLEACTRYSEGIRTIAARAGAPKKFNLTITLGFLSLIAERIQATEKEVTFEEFLALNPELRTRDVLNRWYSPKELNSDFARTHFLLPSR